MKKILTIISIFVLKTLMAQVPSNDACVSPQIITIPASGNVCINSTNVNATSDLTTDACDTGTPGNEVWFTYTVTGAQNTVTVTPTGTPSAQKLVVTLNSTGCASGTYNTCAASATNGGSATASWTYAVGTQVLISVETNGADGGFQICITSVTPPPAPGNSCATATTICNKSNFSVTTFPSNVNNYTPSCFPTALQRPIFYQFTVGQSGTCIWTADPTGNAEYDWVIYNITSGCPGSVVCCNFNYANSNGSPIGMATGGAGACGTQGFAGASEEFSPPANLVVGNTYMLVIDNYSNNTVGFNFTWGGTFEIAPVANFSLSPASACGPLTTTITNSSIASVSYSWLFGNGNTSTSQNPPNQTYSIPGTYLVSLVTTSATGCTDVASQSIIVKPIPVVNPITDIVVCNGATIPTSTFASSPAGATFAWTNSNTTTGLGASGSGDYSSFTATNTSSAPITSTIAVTPTLNGCVGTAVTYSITVNPTPTVTNNPLTQALCSGTSSTLINLTSNVSGATFAWTATATAGVTGFTANGTNTIPVQTISTSGGTAGTVTYAITPTANGCSGPITNYTITVNPLPTIAGTLNVCAGSTTQLTGSATANASTPWSSSNTAVATISNTGLVSGLTAGTTTITYTNTDGCVKTAAVTVNPNITPTFTAVAPICSGGSLSPLPTTSNNSITGTWSPALDNTTTTTYTFTPTAGQCATSTTLTISVGPPVTPVFTAISPICSGAALSALPTTSNNGFSGTWSPAIDNTATTTYTFTPTAGQCATTTTLTITVTPLPTATISGTATVCENGTAPTITFTGANATAGYTFTYNINGGANQTVSSVAPSSVATITAPITTSGSYVYNLVSVSSANGCSQNQTGSATITVTPLPTATISGTASVCENGTAPTITFTGANGTADYTFTYNINGGANQTVSSTSPSSIATVTASTVTAGSFIYNLVSVSSTNGCSQAQTGSATITVNANPVTWVNSPTICPTATATLTAGGANSYTWSAGATSTGVNTASASPAVTTTYTVTGTTNGCSSTAVSTVTVGNGLIANAGVDDTICFGGSTVLNATPNTLGNTYVWSPGTGLSNTTVANPTANPTTTTNYTITITTAGGCSSSDNVTIYSDPQINIAIAGIDITCNGYNNGQTIVIPSGGTSPYSYSWTGGCTGASCTGLTPGSYTVTVTDAYNCTAIADTSITEPTLLSATVTNTPASCHGVCNGTATVTCTGGTAGYSYSWNTTPVQTTATATNLCAGTYICTITDANGCTKTINTTISEPPLVVIAPIVSPTICFGGNTTLTANASGGNGGPYSYTWSPATGLSSTTVANPTATPVSTTLYTVNATDINGCAAAAVNVTVTVTPPLSVLATGTGSICPTETLPINATASNGNGGPYNYTWSPVTGLSNPNIDNPTASPATTTTYTVTANDGCSPAVTATVTISVNPLPNPIFFPDKISGCPPVCVNFTESSTVASGLITSWNWDFGGAGTSSTQEPSFCFTNPGQYNVTLTITTDQNCSSISSPQVITVFPNPEAAFSPTPNPASVLESNVTLNNQSSTDVNYWNWTFGDGDSLAPGPPSPTHTYPNDMAGNYTATLIVQNSNGCYDTISHEIIIEPEFTFFIPNAFSPNGDNTNDTFYGQGIGIAKYEMYIFDRWGNNIFYTDDITKAWDGKANHGSEICQEDIYVWKVKLKDVLGKKHDYIGTVTIVK